MRKIRKERKNKNTNAFVMAGVVALLFSAIGYGVMLAGENAVLGKYDRTSVYILKEDLKSGTQIDDKNVSEYFNSKNIDTEIVPTNAITDLKQLDGTYIKQDTPKNSVITESMFQKMDEVIEGDKEIGINISSLAGSVNGILRASDYIDIYIIPKNYSDYVGKDTNNENNGNNQSEGITYVVDGEVLTEEQYNDKVNEDTTEDADKDTDETTNENTDKNTQGITTNAVSIAPTYEHVYVNKVFDDDGDIISNNDTEAKAGKFNVILPKEDADYLIGAIQTGSVYIVLNR